MTEQNKIEQIPDKNLEKVEKPSEILQEGTFERGEISPETFAQERIETIDQEVAQLEHEGRRGIESASASVGLEPAKVQQAQKETATKGKLEQISESVQSFANDATEKICLMVLKLKDAIVQIDKQMVREWLEDFEVKTFAGLRFQTSILKRVAEIKKLPFTEATSSDESKNIDGYIGGEPVTVKPISHKTKNMLPEQLPKNMIYYEKLKGVIVIEFDF